MADFLNLYLSTGVYFYNLGDSGCIGVQYRNIWEKNNNFDQKTVYTKSLGAERNFRMISVHWLFWAK